MADVQNIETRFYVGRINRRTATVEVISFDDWNGLFGTNAIPTPQQSFPDPQQANRVINALNGLYDDKGIKDFRCYLLRNVENITHIVGDVDQSYVDVFNEFYNLNEDGTPQEPEVPTEPVPELPAEETP